jgi:hypothetical protein
MSTEIQIILFIFSSILGYLARMKIKSTCCCCECEVERDIDNKVESVRVIKKSKSRKDLSSSSIVMPKHYLSPSETDDSSSTKSTVVDSGSL